MSGGGGGEESKRESKEQQHAVSLRRSEPDDYGRAVAKLAVAQICEGVGFNCLKQSALEALSDIAVRYMCDLGKSANLYASLAGRSEVNVFDILRGLEDLGSMSGFSGASEVNCCVAGSRIVKDMAEFVGKAEEIPFAQPIPQFPVIKCRKGIPSFSQMGEAPSGNHIPPWLPALPDPHTYKYTPKWNERKTDPRTDKVEQVRQRRKAEQSLLSLQQRLLSNGLAGPSGSGQNDPRALTGNNPFLDPPLAAGDQDVNAPAEKEAEMKQVSVFETFSPAIDSMKGGVLVSDPMELDKRIPERKPVVYFKLKAGKKMLVEDLDVNLRNHSKGTGAPWAGRDDERDDKKRRAELILRQSMENPPEPSQM